MKCLTMATYQAGTVRERCASGSQSNPMCEIGQLAALPSDRVLDERGDDGRVLERFL